jgi:hypothetical protein
MRKKNAKVTWATVFPSALLDMTRIKKRAGKM